MLKFRMNENKIRIFKENWLRNTIVISIVMLLSIASGIIVVQLMASGQIANQWGNWRLKIILLAVMGIIGVWLVLKHPAYLFLFVIISSSTLPVLVYGQILSLGGTAGANIRLEYVLFLVLLFLFFLRQVQTNINTPLDIPIFMLVVFQCLSLVVALSKGYSFGIGPAIRLIESYVFFFLASRLTTREQIPGLMRWINIIAITVALAIILTSLTGSRSLYTTLFTDNPNNVKNTIFYGQFFLGAETPRIGYVVGDPLLLMALLFGTAMIFLGTRHKGFYYIIILMVATRALISGQRFWIAWLVFAFLLTFAFSTYFRKKDWIRRSLRNFIVIGLLALILFGLFYTQSSLSIKVDTLVNRSRNTIQNIQSSSQTEGISLAWHQLLTDPSGFITGFSPFRDEIFVDINFGMLVTIYQYGVAGLIVMIWMLTASFIQGWKQLKSRLLRPEEAALICAILIFILIQVGNGFIRGSVFNEDGVSLILFSIMLGWVQTISRDGQKELEEGLANS
jgi:hypothetical protein